MRVVSMASSSDIGGRIVGMRLASMVLPAPGGPRKIMLWLPAQATSSARLAPCCPRTSRRSTAYCAASASSARASSCTGVKRFRRVHQIHGLRQRFDGVHVDAFHHGGFARVGFRHHQRANALLARAQRRRKRAAHRAHAAVERSSPRKTYESESGLPKNVPGSPESPAPWADRTPSLPCECRRARD